MTERLVDKIRSPKDLAGLDAGELRRLAQEIRALITETVA